MTEFHDLPLPGAWPLGGDDSRAMRTLDRLRDQDDPALARLLNDPRGRAMVTALAAHSSYLAGLLVRDGKWFAAAAQDGFDRAAKAGLDAIVPGALASADQAGALAQLRAAKRRLALLIAAADVGGLWPLERVTYTLTELADQALLAAVRFFLRAEAAKGRVQFADPAAPEAASGLILLAMGKYGAGELNYSSDIDFIIFFDPAKLDLPEGEHQEFFIRLGRFLVKALGEVTADGYVFRTDLRLRPDAGATPIAVSVEAAENYYESMGQNWERAAMIKARPVACDQDAAQRFFTRVIRPFVWRRHLDYAAIADIHSIKRQIHAHKGHSVIAVEGHDIKLGRGGIREIEFFVQTQQLIAGGRNPDLRGCTTLGALAALRTHGLVSAGAERDLTRAYVFLRTLEHRLQMTADEQTHRLPSDPAGVAAVAAFAGFPSAALFADALVSVLTLVQGHYAALFEKEESLDATGGSLVFTGTDDDPETLVTLKGMGFCDTAMVASRIRAWHHGRIRATRSERARELLTRLVPQLLAGIGKAANPDTAFLRFDTFLGHLPAGVQIFSLLLAHQGLLSLVIRIMGSAPRLAELLGRRVEVLDAVLTPGFFDELPGSRGLARSFAIAMHGATGMEDRLDRARLWAAEQRFRVAAQVLGGYADAREAGPAFTRIAETVLAALCPLLVEMMSAQHGAVAGGRLALLGFGKLGGGEMADTSDLDLVVLYDFPPDLDQTAGPKPLDPGVWFTRWTQRLISAVTAPTPKGRLYDVDMRLRPSGNKGPIATRFAGFLAYQAREAWTWEHLALSRARVIWADSTEFGAEAAAAIRDVLARPRDAGQTAADVADMRERVARDRGSSHVWDVKEVRGGLIDLEFLVQYLQLAHAQVHPDVLSPNSLKAIDQLAAKGLLAAEDAGTLRQAAVLFQNIAQVLRICVDGAFDWAQASPDLRILLMRAAAVTAEEEVAAALQSAQEAVNKLFERYVSSRGAGRAKAGPAPAGPVL